MDLLITDKLVEFIKQIQAADISRDHKEWTIMEISECVSHYYKQMLTALEAGSNKVEMLLGAYDAFDRMAKVDNEHHKPSCKKGCAYCCHIPVNVTLTEVALIKEYMEENGTVLSEAQKERARFQARVSDKVRMTSDKSACIFLDDNNACSIYEVRPFKCRSHYVVNDPALCNYKVNPGHQTKVIALPHALCIESAFLNVVRNSHNLANAVIEIFKI